MRAGDWTVPQAPPDLTDRRVEITGPTERKMTINALNSGAKVWLADLEDANTPHWANVVDGQQNLYDAIRRTISLKTDEEDVRAERRPVPDDRGPPARLAPRRAAPAGGRRAGGRRPGRLRPALLPQRPGADRQQQRAVLLPAEDGVAQRGGAVERRLHVRPGRARHPAGHDPGHRADRDHPGRVRDGRDPARAAPAHLRAERGPLGLPVQHHQVLPGQPGDGAAGPGRGDHDGAVHAGVHRTARLHLPPPRRLRDGRDGGVHPVPARPRGQRGGPGQGPRGQGARGGRRLRRFLGGAPRPGAGVPGDLRPGARRPSQPARQAARRRLGAGRAVARRGLAGRGGDRGRSAVQRVGRLAISGGLAARQRRGRASTT